MKIDHKPIFKTKEIEKIYSQRDGVDVKYVCTTDIRASDCPMDVYYRATPHPEFGNHYFGLYIEPYTGTTYITGADAVEELEFGMIKLDDIYYYSQSHHDYNVVGHGESSCFIDGGRHYVRSNTVTEMFKVKDGEFVPMNPE